MEIDLSVLPRCTNVWCPELGDGVIVSTNKEYPYNIRVSFKTAAENFTSEGRLFLNSPYPTLSPSKEAWLENPTNPWKDFKFPIKDKTLVWCWDNNWKTTRVLHFYNAKTNGIFDIDGDRISYHFDNIEPYEGEEPEWAIKAREILSD